MLTRPAIFRSLTSWETALDAGPNNLNFLRLLFATAVIYTHSYDLLHVPGELLQSLSKGQLAASGLAVNGFFIISGFLISHSWSRSSSAASYLKRRAARILPGFVVCVLLCFLLLAPLGASSLSAYIHDPTSYRFLTLLLGKGPQTINAAFPANPEPGNVNGSLWTIRVEALCYLVVMLWGALKLLRSHAATLFLAIACLMLPYLLALFPHLALPLVAFQTLAVISSFCCGMALWRFKQFIPQSILLALVAAACMFVAITPLRTLAWSYLVLFAGFAKPRILPLADRTDLSYGIYLYAFPLQQLFIHRFPQVFTPHPLLLVAATVALTYPLAYLSWTFIESPFLKTARRRPATMPSALPLAVPA